MFMNKQRSCIYSWIKTRMHICKNLTSKQQTETCLNKVNTQQFEQIMKQMNTANYQSIQIPSFFQFCSIDE